jgi:hypothetical protein
MVRIQFPRSVPAVVSILAPKIIHDFHIVLPVSIVSSVPHSFDSSRRWLLEGSEITLRNKGPYTKL